jgi:hypothetical protein
MRSIERLVRDELAAFIELPERSYYQDDHAEFLRMLETKLWIDDNNWKPAYEVFGDHGLTSELGQFIDDFRLWSQEVSEIRGQWFYDHMADELPDDHLSVFGCTSPLALHLEPMLNRCRRIIRRIDELHTATQQGESVKAKSEATPQAEIALTPNEIAFLMAAKKLGASKEIMAAAHIEAEAFGKGSSENRRVRNSLRDKGLIRTEPGRGTALTQSGIEYLARRAEV